ncbi:MAG: hypothetical protein ABSG43_09985 [Solirubrobacteraceae bacterium]|jgi:hypothetical protein
MCSHQEWESLRRRFEAVDEDQVLEFAADVAARIDAFVEHLTSRGCRPEDVDWVRRRGRRSRTDWVA